MKTLIISDGTRQELYQLLDPDAPSEIEFEASVACALASVHQSYRCIVFGGSFLYDTEIYQPDLALVAKDFSHWFIIEVELVTHSFSGHVLPQVRAFRYGQPQPDCASQLARALNISERRAMTLISLVPYAVVVIANKRDPRWEIALSAHGIQLLAVSAFRSVSGIVALQLDGNLEVVEQSLGFGVFSVTDRSLRFDRATLLPCGSVQINDPAGAPALWTVTRDERFAWVRKDIGMPDIENGASVQLRRTVGGRLTLRRPRTPNLPLWR